jgi:outer membrane autotransporter protein
MLVFCKSRTAVRGAAVLCTVAVAMFAFEHAASAQSWRATPTDGDYNNAANWFGGVPGAASTANFGQSSITTIAVPASPGQVNTWSFISGADDYTMDIETMTFSGMGVVVNGGSHTLNILGVVRFDAGSSSGIIYSPGSTVTLSVDGTILQYKSTSNAGSSSIAMQSGAQVDFQASSSAASAHITNDGGTLGFFNTATAGQAVIVNNSTVQFSDDATAGSAAITNNSNLYFYDRSIGGDAAITNNSNLYFNDQSTGGNAAITTTVTGTTDFSQSSGPNSDNKLSAGSLAGAGAYILGANALTVGGNNQSTEVSGIISGVDGSLVKSGTGTMVLSGDNTYTGTTTISGGRLEIGNGGIGGSIAGNVVLSGGTFGINQSDSFTFGNTISGSGSFNQMGTGTTILTQDNSFTGTTTISHGTLRLGAAGTTGGVTGNIVANGALVFDRSNTFTYGGIISGGGSLTQAGTGTTILTGNNSLEGPATISGGTLQLGDGGTTGRLMGNVANNSHFAINRSDAYTFGRIISGSGDFTQAGTGTTILTNNNTYTGGTTISAGKLQLGNAGTTGGIAGDILVDAGELIINRSNAYTMSGEITGGGTFRQAGTGNTTLTGNNVFAGSIFVDAGRLSVDGSLGYYHNQANHSTTTVNGGELGGVGTIDGELIVNAGGTLAPGNSIGTLTVNNDVTFDTGAYFQAEIAPDGTSDLLQVNGVVTINGGTVVVLAPSGEYVPGTAYTIVSATGGVNGEFAALDTTLAFITPEIEYTDNKVLLNIARNDVKFTEVAITYNQTAVAGALQQLPPGNPLYDAVVGQTAAGAQQAFDALSGEVHASVSSVLVDQTHFVRGTILDRMIQASYGSTSGEVVALGAGGPVAVAMRSAQPAPVEGRMALGAGASDYVEAPARSASGYGEGLVFWTQGYGSWAQYDGNGNAATVDRSLGGFVSGVDTALDHNWRAGLATGYTRSDLSVGARSSSSDVNSYLLAAYAGGSVGPLALRSGASWSWNTIDTTRNVIFPGFFATETANYDGDVGQLFAEIAHPLLHGGTAFEPFAGLAWVHLGTDGFSESPGTAALSASSSNDDVGYSTLGLRAAATMPFHGVMVTPRGSLAWQYAFGDTTPDLALAFATSGVGFGIAGIPLAQNSALVEAGVDVLLSADAKFGISYIGQLAGALQDNGVQADFRWQF